MDYEVSSHLKLSWCKIFSNVILIPLAFAGDHQCAENQYKCATSPLCIPIAFYCDGSEDCPDGSDEPALGCVHPDVTCPPGYFKCANGRCISESWVSF